VLLPLDLDDPERDADGSLVADRDGTVRKT
jgi:hypothetical protein